MKETIIKQQGYKYYVYISPGNIEYFYNYRDAAFFAKKYNAEVQEVIC